jgi:hypothetical protein
MIFLPVNPDRERVEGSQGISVGAVDGSPNG